MKIGNGAGSSPLGIWSSNFNTETADIPLDSLMGLTTLGWSSGGDPTCLYDYDNGIGRGGSSLARALAVCL